MSWPSWLNWSSPQWSPDSSRANSSLDAAQASAPPPAAAAAASSPTSGEWGSVAHHAGHLGQEASASTAAASPERSSGHRCSPSRTKRKRDEGPAVVVARSSSAQSAHSAADEARRSAGSTMSDDNMMDVDDGVEEADVGPASKRRREAAAPEFESSPPQSFSRGKFRITHHDVVPGEKKQGPLFSTGKSPLLSAAAGERRRWSDGKRKDDLSPSRRPRPPGRASRRSSAPVDPKYGSMLSADGEPPPGPYASRFSAAAGASSSERRSVFAFGGGAAGCSGAAGNDAGSDSSALRLPGVGSPSLVVIDGSNAAFGYREGGGRWRAEGPLLAMQYFQDRGVKTVAFIPRQRVDSVSPQDDAYPALQEARASGAISLVPAGGNDDLFFLKYAIDRDAPVVSNDQFRDHAANDETLAALGRTRAELLDYLSGCRVSYTFAGDEFVPNPEAQAIKAIACQELSRSTSDQGSSSLYAATGAPSCHAPPESLPS